jgi:hypothetical protein
LTSHTPDHRFTFALCSRHLSFVSSHSSKKLGNCKKGMPKLFAQRESI